MNAKANNIPMEILLNPSLELATAKSIRTEFMRLHPDNRQAIRRGRVMIRVPMGLAVDGPNVYALKPGRPTVHLEDESVAMLPGERRVLCDYDRIKSVAAAKVLVREMEMAMIEDIRISLLRDLDTYIAAGEQLAALALAPEGDDADEA